MEDAIEVSANVAGATVTVMQQEIQRLRDRIAELEAAHQWPPIETAPNGDRIYQLRQMPTDIAPKNVPLLIAGGIAMKKTGGDWYSGMCEPAFSRKLNWSPEWWANIPQQNDPHPTPPEDKE